MRSSEDSLAFIDECHFAVDHLIGAMSERLTAFHALGEELAVIERAEEFLHGLFVGRDQWSPDANYHHAKLVERMSALAKQREGMGTASSARSEELLARMGATEEAMAILAGAILQIGKQVISFRFGPKPRLDDVRLIGTQSVVEVIWEGRNHALHWEEEKGWGDLPSLAVKMLTQLGDETSVEVIPRSNNAFAVVAVLGWSSTAEILKDLRALVALDARAPG